MPLSVNELVTLSVPAFEIEPAVVFVRISVPVVFPSGFSKVPVVISRFLKIRFVAAVCFQEAPLFIYAFPIFEEALSVIVPFSVESVSGASRSRPKIIGLLL